MVGVIDGFVVEDEVVVVVFGVGGGGGEVEFEEVGGED